MKKIIIIITLFLIITGCANDKLKENNIEEYFLTYKDSNIKVDNLYNNTLIMLGEYNEVRQEASSYCDGEANIYSYDDFEIETYYDDKEEKISNVTITSNQIETNEGIKLGDNIDKLIKAYGKEHKKPNDNTYNYNLGKTNISFIIENDIIISIEYFLS